MKTCLYSRGNGAIIVMWFKVVPRKAEMALKFDFIDNC